MFRRRLVNSLPLSAGVAYARSLFQIYTLVGDPPLPSLHMEEAAHTGAVNDLAFSEHMTGQPQCALCVVTCGDDGLVKVWNLATRQKLYDFSAHKGPVYSVYPHMKNGVMFVFSMSRSGQTHAWLLDDPFRTQVQYEAPGKWCCNLAYSKDDAR